MHSRPVVFPRLKKYSYGILSSEYYIPYDHHLNPLYIKTRTHLNTNHTQGQAFKKKAP